MSVQDVRNETARIAGGTLVRPGVYKGAGAISAGGRSVAVAYGYLPEPGELSEDAFAHVSYLERTAVNPQSVPPGAYSPGDLNVYRHHIAMELLYAPKRSDQARAIELLTPFAEAYRDAFAARTRLGGTAPGGSYIEGWELAEGIYEGYLALKFHLVAIEKVALALAA